MKYAVISSSDDHGETNENDKRLKNLSPAQE
jgi:hypothetical protein